MHVSRNNSKNFLRRNNKAVNEKAWNQGVPPGRPGATTRLEMAERAIHGALDGSGHNPQWPRRPPGIRGQWRQMSLAPQVENNH